MFRNFHSCLHLVEPWFLTLWKGSLPRDLQSHHQPSAFWNCLASSMQWHLPQAYFVSSLLPVRSKRRGMRSRGAAHQRNRTLKIRVQARPAFLPVSSLLLCFFFLNWHFLRLILSRSCSFLSFDLLLQERSRKKSVGRKMGSLRCTTRSGCLSWSTWKRTTSTLDQTPLDYPFSCWWAWAFQRSVIKNTIFFLIFPPNPDLGRWPLLLVVDRENEG